jgi:hypothetical protein
VSGGIDGSLYASLHVPISCVCCCRFGKGANLVSLPVPTLDEKTGGMHCAAQCSAGSQTWSSACAVCCLLLCAQVARLAPLALAVTS